MFGLSALVMFLTIGAAVDMGRWLHARSETKSAVDSAVLAGARILQIDSRNPEKAMEAAQRFYEENTKHRAALLDDTISFKVGEGGTTVTAEGAAHIETTFLKLASINSLPLLKLSGSEFSEAILAVGGNAEQSIEVSLMLDVTGSMSGQKLEDMKGAAKDLIDILVWEDQGAHTSRVALVPFSASVNTGSILNSTIQSGPATRSFARMNGWTATWNRATNCASERTGAEAYTDAAPNSEGNKVGLVYTSNGNCEPNVAMVPLSADKALLKSTIDGFTAAGSTGGQLGTAWAWYMLSPNWANVLPAGSKPASYAKLSELNSNGKPLLQKIAVLMTDGEYNIQYCSTGIRDRNSNGGWSLRGTCTAPNGSSATQARTLCANMKAAGITVYSVGFQLEAGGEAEATMAQCATSTDHLYTATNGEQLRQSFRDIALKISELYLSK